MTAKTFHQKLKQTAGKIGAISIEDLINKEQNRSPKFKFEVAGISFDFTKSNLPLSHLDDIYSLADKCKLLSKRKSMFAGDAINFTEDRAVLHFALRNPQRKWVAKGVALEDKISIAKARASAFADKIHNGSIKSKSGQKFDAIIHIGIGGSDLGPRLVYEALKPFGHTGPILRFCANVEPTEFMNAIDGLNPKTTLIVCVSKTFTTIETLTNFQMARDWLQAEIGSDDEDHLVAISAAPEKAVSYGVMPDRIFGFEDWVGGRFSLWSSVGLTLEMAFGSALIDEMHEGAKQMDDHFETAPLGKNLPIFAGLISYWNHNYLEYSSRATIPYAVRLKLLPQFLQQLDMESNGKSVGIKGEGVKSSCPIVWGAEGTNAQHAFFQHLHQSPIITPIEFLLVADDGTKFHASTRLTHANALAQAEALMRGKSIEVVKTEMAAQGKNTKEIARIAPHRVFSGNRPSTTILMPKLDAFSLGALLAFYEHRTFVEGVLWGVNSFDQWGVELGKGIAIEIDTDLANGPSNRRDNSTAKMIEKLRNMN